MSLKRPWLDVSEGEDMFGGLERKNVHLDLLL